MFLTMCLVLTGCGDDEGTSRRKKKKDDDESAPRTIDVSENLTDHDYFEYEFDFDGDGTEEEIKIDYTKSPENEWLSQMNVTIGDYEKSIDVDGSWIEKVYICDIDTTDDTYDLAVIANEMSSDPVIRIFAYDGALSQYEFRTQDFGVFEEQWLGYAVSYYFNVNEDDTITLEMQTPNSGMWSVYRTFERDEYGIFCEVIPEKYEILPDFMERAFTDDLTDEEIEMWEDGYILAHTDYDCDGFSIETGEYIKPLYDDGENKIYVEKKNGTGGWIDIGYESDFDRYNFNFNFFYLAG